MSNLLYGDEDYALWWLIVQSRRAMHNVRRKELFQAGITPVEASVLFIVQAIGHKSTPAEIARWLFRKPHSVSSLLARMAKRGLVRKVSDLERKNQVRVIITEKGRDAYHQSTKRESIHRMMSSLSDEQRRELRSSLQLLRDKALEELGVARPPFPPFE